MTERIVHRDRRASWVLPLLALLGLLLLSLLAAGASEHLRVRAERLAQAERDATALALLVDQHVSRVFEGVDDGLARMADKIGHRSWRQIERSLPVWDFANQLIDGLQLLHSIEIYDADGHLRLSSEHFPAPSQGTIAFDATDALTALADSSAPVLLVRRSGDGNSGWLLGVVRAIQAPHAPIRGFVVGTLEPHAIGDFFRWAPIGEHGAIELLYRDGTAVVTTERALRSAAQTAATVRIATRLSREPGGRHVIRGDVLGDGIPRVVAIHSMPRLPFMVLVEMTQSDILKDWRRRFIWDAAIAGGAMLGFVILAILLYRKIAGEQRATMAARLAEQRLSDAVESIGEGFALWDAEDRLVICNDKYRQLHAAANIAIEPGTGFETLVRASAEAGIYRLDDSREAWVAERVRRHRSAASTFEQQHANGNWLLVSERHTSEGGIVGIRTDITALKSKEVELERLVLDLEGARARTEAQAAELARLAEGYAEAHREASQANATKTLFLASMSHELRTPLNAILGFSELMARETFGPLGHAKYKEYVTDVHRSGQHLLDLISDVLDLSKIEAGKLALRLERQNLQELVDESVRLVADRAQAKAILLEISLPRNLPHVRADRRAAKQILLNLLSNAVKFTQQGGAVSITGSARNGIVTIAIKDTGIGIASRDIDRLFKPFERARNAEQLEGSGLGLAIARALAERNGGALRLESQVGEGTVVWLDLPMDSEGQPIADAA